MSCLPPNIGKMGHFGKVCLQKHVLPAQQQQAHPQAKTLYTNDLPLVHISELANKPLTHAPTVKMQVATCNGQTSFDILPDSGADICAAGPQFVQALGESMNNLAYSNISPRAVNGSTLHPVGPMSHSAAMARLPTLMFTFTTQSLAH